MKTLKSIILTVSAAMLAMTATAQSDFGIWTGAEATKKLGNFKLSAEGGFRAQNDLKSVDRWNAGIGVEYEPVKNLEIGTSYNFIYDYKFQRKKSHFETWQELDADGNEVEMKEYDGYNIKKPYWRVKNRWNFDVTGKLPIGRFTVSLRERYQFTRENHVTSINDKYRLVEPSKIPSYKESERKDHEAGNESRLRSRLKVDYDIRKCPVEPYAFIEFNNNLRRHLNLMKTRVSVGAEYKINKRNRISAGWLYQDINGEDDDWAGSSHVIDISYKYKF